MHKAGFVNIIGSPNVGKSTLMNGLVGERISIITSKHQTTRHRIMGIVNGEDFQVVYSDTPGVLNPHYKLQEDMMNFVTSALSDADVILFVTDIFESEMNHPETFEKLQKMDTPILLLINKIDLADQARMEERVSYWAEKLPKAQILPISALHKVNLEFVFNKIIELLPENPPYFDKDALTDKPLRFFISEIVREKILENYSKEIPYSCEVVVESYKDEPNIAKIEAIIYVARESQKGIIIGHQGSKIKKTGTEAREIIEEFIGKKVFLKLDVKVDKDWRDSDSKLKRYGYKQ
jgi:GTP-binding protein Era